MIITGMSRGAVESLVRSGFGAFDWLGTGITSSTAAANANTAATALGVLDNAEWLYDTFSGQPVSETDILIKYTWTADANLDGLVDSDDFNKFLDGYNNGLPCGAPPTWFTGDWDYNGIVDADDFQHLLNGLAAFNASGHQQL